MRISTSQVRPAKLQLTRKGRLLAAGVLLVLVSGLIVLAWVQLVFHQLLLPITKLKTIKKSWFNLAIRYGTLLHESRKEQNGQRCLMKSWFITISTLLTWK